MLFQVNIIMPQCAKNSFLNIVKTRNIDKVYEDIEEVISRIDIRHASATMYRDKTYVFEKLESSIGANALNIFLKDVFRSALLTVGQLKYIWSPTYRIVQSIAATCERSSTRKNCATY